MARRSLPVPVSNLTLRLLSATVGLPLLGLVLWMGGPLFVLVAVAVASLALSEVLGLLHRAGRQVLLPEGVVWGALIVLVTAVAGWPLAVASSGLAVAGISAVVLVVALLRKRSSEALGAWVVTAAGVVYIALPLASVAALRPLPSGLEWLLVAFLGVFATDTGAYVVGRLFGRHKMAPDVSPGKTWEGAVGGLLAGLGVTAALIALLESLNFVLWAVVLLAAAVGIMSQAGDLLESKLKRLAGAKESGRLIPGHGGLLDRLDSLVLVFPVVYYAALGWPA